MVGDRRPGKRRRRAMSATERPEIPLETRIAQARASDPAASAWVSANAGSGKTHVLAQRALRLLLGGAPRAAGLAFSRRVFARTIETPGGLKIQTIHAFCERLLHLFPFEANVAARFEVVDDQAQAELLERARREALAEAQHDAGALGRAYALL